MKETAPFRLYQAWKVLARLGLKLDEAGSLSRLGSARRIFQRGIRDGSFGPDVLLDFNPTKFGSGVKVWPSISFLNPFELRPTLIERCCLMVSLLLRDVPRRALQAVGLGWTVKSNTQGARVFFWNPYSMFHFAIAEVVGICEITVLTPEYPLPSGNPKVVGPKVVGEIYGLEKDQFRAMDIPHSFVREKPVLSLFLSKTTIHHARWSGWEEQRQVRKIEDRLVAFGTEMIRRGVETEFFLHYSERSREMVEQISYPIHEYVNLGESLHSLSSRQICLTGASTISFKLASLGVPHAYVLTVGEGEDTPYLNWSRQQENVLDVEASDDDWVACLWQWYPKVAAEILLCAIDR